MWGQHHARMLGQPFTGDVPGSSGSTSSPAESSWPLSSAASRSGMLMTAPRRVDYIAARLHLPQAGSVNHAASLIVEHAAKRRQPDGTTRAGHERARRTPEIAINQIGVVGDRA